MSETPKSSLIRNIVDELNNDSLPQKLLLPYIEYVKSAIKPYYTTHIVLQLIIIVLLILILLKVRRI